MDIDHFSDYGNPMLNELMQDAPLLAAQCSACKCNDTNLYAFGGTVSFITAAIASLVFVLIYRFSLRKRAPQTDANYAIEMAIDSRYEAPPCYSK